MVSSAAQMESWTGYFRTWTEYAAWAVERLWRAGAHVMGCATYRDMAAHWPSSSEPYAAPMNQIPKVVFSGSLKSAVVFAGSGSEVVVRPNIDRMNHRLHLQIILLTIAAVTIAGCAGVGVVATDDPAAKLRDATYLFDRQDRPLIAERLIREAIVSYQSNNDQLGLAEAYRTYGFFFRSRAINGKWGNYYRKNGFLDRSATFDTRYDKSIEYFEMARQLFAESKRFDALTNVDLNIGFTYIAMGNRLAACRAFDRSLENNQENIRQIPDAAPNLPVGFGSYEEFIADQKKRWCCDGTLERKEYRSAYLVVHGGGGGGGGGDMDALVEQELLLHHLIVKLGPEQSVLQEDNSLVVRYEDHWWWKTPKQQPLLYYVMFFRAFSISLHDGQSGELVAKANWDESSRDIHSTLANIVKHTIEDVFARQNAVCRVD
jgi:tetratricopeptide (TPR) repeat protein